MKYLPEGEVWEKGVSIDRMWIDAFFTEHVVRFVQVRFVTLVYCSCHLVPSFLVFFLLQLLLFLRPLVLSLTHLSTYLCCDRMGLIVWNGAEDMYTGIYRTF